MEEKTNEISRSVRSVFNPRNFSKFFLLPYNSSQNHGFTLVELLIVMAVMGVLASGLLVLVNPAEQMRRARDSKVKSNVAQIQTALELFRADCGRYPATLPSSGSTLTSASCPGYSGPTATYMTMPSFSTPPTYPAPGNGNSTYNLSACLESSRYTAGDGVVASSCASGWSYSAVNP